MLLRVTFQDVLLCDPLLVQTFTCPLGGTVTVSEPQLPGIPKWNQSVRNCIVEFINRNGETLLYLLHRLISSFPRVLSVSFNRFELASRQEVEQLNRSDCFNVLDRTLPVLR